MMLVILRSVSDEGSALPAAKIASDKGCWILRFTYDDNPINASCRTP